MAAAVEVKSPRNLRAISATAAVDIPNNAITARGAEVAELALRTLKWEPIQ
jgi:hypothetical protein